MRWIILTLGLILSLSLPVFAQGSKTLTNDDFPSGQRSDAKTTGEKDKEKELAAKDTEGKDKDGKEDKDSKDGKEDKDPAKAAQAKKEQDWQKKYAEVEKKNKELDQQKTQLELSVQQMRNRLRAGGGNPQDFDALSEQLRQAENNLKSLNSKYDETQKSLDSFKQEGESSGYKAKKEEIPKTDKDGRPNPTYYTKTYSDLSEKQRMAESKIQLYQSRINEAQQRALQGRSNNGNRVGNPYYTDPETKRILEEAQREMQKAQEDLQKSGAALQELQRDARTKGVSIK